MVTGLLFFFFFFFFCRAGNMLTGLFFVVVGEGNCFLFVFFLW